MSLWDDFMRFTPVIHPSHLPPIKGSLKGNAEKQDIWIESSAPQTRILKRKLNVKTKNLVGYARVSTGDQNLSMQELELKAYGCKKIFNDQASGAKNDRHGLTECLKSLCEGDVLVVWKLDRLGRSLPHLVSIISSLKKKGVGFKSLRDGAIDTTTPSGELIFHIFAALAQFERELIRERTKAGLAAARARGKIGGRRPKNINDPVVKTARRMHADGLSIEEICTALKISGSTLHRYVNMEDDNEKK